MRRRLVSSLTIVIAATGLAGCGSDGSSAEQAGREVGEYLGMLQSTVMTRSADFKVEGVEKRLQDLKGEVPADVFTELEQIQSKLHDQVIEAENHPDALAEVSGAAVKAFEAVQGSGAALNDFKQGVREGFDVEIGALN